MAPDQNSAMRKRSYTAPSLVRMPIGATATSTLPNGDATNSPGTAFGNTGS